MSLIIDIPEEEYNSGTLVNYFGCYSEKLDEVIYNAPTVEMAEDCVKREDAKKFLYERLDRLNDDELYDIFSKIIDDMYNELPPVTPQPKRGKWIVIRKEYEFMGGIVNEPQGCKCSNCNGIVRFKSDFCPSCGADMRDIRETGITAKEGMEIAKAFHDGIMAGFAESEDKEVQDE